MITCAGGQRVLSATLLTQGPAIGFTKAYWLILAADFEMHPRLPFTPEMEVTGESTIIHCIQKFHTHSNGTTAPSRKSFLTHFAILVMHPRSLYMHSHIKLIHSRPLMHKHLMHLQYRSKVCPCRLKLPKLGTEHA